MTLYAYNLQSQERSWLKLSWCSVSVLSPQDVFESRIEQLDYWRGCDTDGNCRIQKARTDFGSALLEDCQNATRGAPGLTTNNKKLLGTKGIATRSKDATRSRPPSEAELHRWRMWQVSGLGCSACLSQRSSEVALNLLVGFLIFFVGVE